MKEEVGGVWLTADNSNFDWVVETEMHHLQPLFSPTADRHTPLPLHLSDGCVDDAALCLLLLVLLIQMLAGDGDEVGWNPTDGIKSEIH